MTTYFAARFDGKYHFLRWHQYTPITIPKDPVKGPTLNTLLTNEEGVDFVQKMVPLQPGEEVEYDSDGDCHRTINTIERVRKCEYYTMVFNLRHIYGTEFPVVRPDLFEAYHEALKNRGDEFITVSDHIIHTDRALVARFNNHVRFLGDKERLVLSDNPPKINGIPIEPDKILKFWTSVEMPLSDILDKQFARGEGFIWGFYGFHNPVDLTIWFNNDNSYYRVLHTCSIRNDWLYYLLESRNFPNLKVQKSSPK